MFRLESVETSTTREERKRRESEVTTISSQIDEETTIQTTGI